MILAQSARSKSRSRTNQSKTPAKRSSSTSNEKWTTQLTVGERVFKVTFAGINKLSYSLTINYESTGTQDLGIGVATVANIFSVTKDFKYDNPKLKGVTQNIFKMLEALSSK